MRITHLVFTIALTLEATVAFADSFGLEANWASSACSPARKNENLRIFATYIADNGRCDITDLSRELSDHLRKHLRIHPPVPGRWIHPRHALGIEFEIAGGAKFSAGKYTLSLEKKFTTPLLKISSFRREFHLSPPSLTLELADAWVKAPNAGVYSAKFTPTATALMRLKPDNLAILRVGPAKIKAGDVPKVAIEDDRFIVVSGLRPDESYEMVAKPSLFPTHVSGAEKKVALPDLGQGDRQAARKRFEELRAKRTQELTSRLTVRQCGSCRKDNLGEWTCANCRDDDQPLSALDRLSQNWPSLRQGHYRLYYQCDRTHGETLAVDVKPKGRVAAASATYTNAERKIPMSGFKSLLTLEKIFDLSKSALARALASGDAEYRVIFIYEGQRPIRFDIRQVPDQRLSCDFYNLVELRNSRK